VYGLISGCTDRVSSSALYLRVRPCIDFLFAGVYMALTRPFYCQLCESHQALARLYQVRTVLELHGLLVFFSQLPRAGSCTRLSFLLRYSVLLFSFTSSKVHVGPSQSIPAIRSLTRSMAGTYSLVETTYAFTF
jgi:hypothetical protein